MKFRNLIWCSCLFILLRPSFLMAQSDIQGIVRDAQSGEALPFASVIISGSNRGATTNSDGYFVLVNAPLGKVDLVFNYIGYYPDSIRIDNKPDDTFTHLFRLEPVTYQLGDVVIVTNSEMLDISSNEVSRVTISPKQLKLLPSVGEVDIFRAIQLLPGITGASDGESGLYIRGGTPDQNLVLFDGMTIYHVDHFFGFFSAFNTDAIKDIQLYKGGFPAEYGGRISSVINITGKTGDEKKFQFGAGANMLSAHTYIEIPLWNRVNLLVAGRRSYTDFIQSRSYNRIYETLTGEEPPSSEVTEQAPQSGSTGPGNGGSAPPRGNIQSAEFKPTFYFYDLNSKLSINPTHKDIVTFSLYSGKDDLDKSQDYSGLALEDQETDLPVNIEITDQNRWGNIGVSGRWARQWTSRMNMDLLLSYSEYFSNFEKDRQLAVVVADDDSSGADVGFASSSLEDNLVKDLSAHLNFTWNAAKDHTLKTGMAFTRFNSEYKYILDDSLTVLDRADDGILTTLFLSDIWSIGVNKITFGLRTSHYDKTGRLYFEPRIAVNIPFLSYFSVKGAWGYYYQFVNQIVNENVLEGSRDFWILSNRNLKPTFAEHRILGVNYELPKWLFSVEAYYKKMDNLTEFSRRFTGQADYSDYFFIGDGVAKGMEFLIQKKNGKLSGWLAYTLGKVEHTFPSIQAETFPAENDRRHELNLVSKYSLGKWTFSATSVYASGKATTEPEVQYVLTMLNGEEFSYIHVGDKNNARLPDYFRLDLSVSRQMEWERILMDIGFSIFNVTNHRNIWYREYNLETVPVTITDALMLGITPTFYLNIRTK